MQQHVSKYYARRPPSTLLGLGMGSVGQNSTLIDHGHVAYQIKDHNECSNMIINILPTDPPPPLGRGSVGQNLTFSKHGHVAYQIKENHE